MAAEEGQVIGCHTVESWADQIQKGNDPGKLVNLLSDCPPPRRWFTFGPVFNSIADPARSP